VLHIRGNKLFGEAGQHGEVQMPPWPSVVAGAIRSRMLADHGVDFAAFARGEAINDEGLHTALGTPHDPGTFRIAWWSLAQRHDGTAIPLLAMPADLNATEADDRITYLRPQPKFGRLKASAVTDEFAVLRNSSAEKPMTGLWLNGVGLSAYLRGEQLSRQTHTVETRVLWRTDIRVGIALDAATRSAATGHLYTTEGIAFKPSGGQDHIGASSDVGFVVRIEGADSLVPANGLVRLGGDGRGAQIETIKLTVPKPDWDGIAKDRCFRLVLTAPGLFEQGWLPTGMREDRVTWDGPDGVSARLVSAAVPRAQVVSGWDIAKWSKGEGGPKPALRAAPTGSVGSGRIVTQACRTGIRLPIWLS
jgi:CRISPR-associated protein Cmr3